MGFVTTATELMVTAVFDNRGQAESAIDNLWHAGFRHDQVGILMPGGQGTEATTATEETEENAATGAVTGAAAGGTIGAVAGGVGRGLGPAGGRAGSWGRRTGSGVAAPRRAPPAS